MATNFFSQAEATLAVDLLIVGLGPAGAAAAKTAAAAGLRVLGIDKNKVLGEPVQCAEFVPLPAGKYCHGLIQQGIDKMRTFLPSGVEEWSDFPGLMIDRAAFDRQFSTAAQAFGALILAKTQFVGLLDQHTALIQQVNAETAEKIEKKVRFAFVIAADGPHSPLAQALGLPPLPTVQTRQYTVPLTAPYAATDIWLSDSYPGGYAWLFPKGAVANLGLGTDRTWASDMKTPLDQLHQALVAEGRVGEAILARTGGAIPVGGLRDPLIYKNCLFAGDAGGFIHPITGAGILPAVVSGEAAAKAVVAALHSDAAALVEYAEDMQDQFADSLERAVARRAELADIWHTPAAQRDAPMRRGWTAFPEYFSA
jgi:geranylgeranyl reductase family protein